MQKLVLVSVVLLTALVLPAAGQAVTTETFTTSQSTFDPGVRNQGWWSGTRINEDSNANYIVGQPDDGGGNRFRNFFTFDLSAACAASSVTLHLTRFEQSGPLTYSLFDVSTPAATLNDNVGPSQAIFDDLGSGISFGSSPFPLARRPTFSVSGSMPQARLLSTRRGEGSSRSAA